MLESRQGVSPSWRGTKGEESFVSDERFGFPPLGGGLRGRKVLYGASDAFPALEWLELSRSPSGGGLRGRKYCIKRKNRDYP